MELLVNKHRFVTHVSDPDTNKAYEMEKLHELNLKDPDHFVALTKIFATLIEHGFIQQAKANASDLHERILNTVIWTDPLVRDYADSLAKSLGAMRLTGLSDHANQLGTQTPDIKPASKTNQPTNNTSKASSNSLDNIADQIALVYSSQPPLNTRAGEQAAKKLQAAVNAEDMGVEKIAQFFVALNQNQVNQLLSNVDPKMKDPLVAYLMKDPNNAIAAQAVTHSFEQGNSSGRGR